MTIKDLQRNEQRLTDDNHSLTTQLKEYEIKVAELEKRLEEASEKHSNMDEAIEEVIIRGIFKILV